MAEGKKRRCFVAINIQPSIRKEIFERLSRKFPAGSCKVVPEENLHITLVFLGYLTEQQIEEARIKMAFLQQEKKFDVLLEGTGSFGGRVFWLGIKKGSEELELIAKRLQKILPVEDERFSAHLTLARNKSLSRPEANQVMDKIAAENFSGSFKVKSVDFMESLLSSKGPSYKKLFSVELAD